MANNLSNEVTIQISSIYDGMNRKSESNELTMTMSKALTSLKKVADTFKAGGYKVTILKTWSNGHVVMPTRFIARKRTRNGSEFHTYEIWE